MTDIARQTVEFLYEENGGMPRDLQLPTIDDIKVQLSRFSIERLRKGTTVVIKSPAGGGGGGSGGGGGGAGTPAAVILPKYAVRAMLHTFGLTGVILDVDQVTGAWEACGGLGGRGEGGLNQADIKP